MESKYLNMCMHSEEGNGERGKAGDNINGVMRAQTMIFGEATGARELFKKMTGGMKGRGERTCSRGEKRNRGESRKKRRIITRR